MTYLVTILTVTLYVGHCEHLFRSVNTVKVYSTRLFTVNKTNLKIIFEIFCYKIKLVCSVCNYKIVKQKRGPKTQITYKMSKPSTAFVDKVVEACFKLYDKTPKSGKPAENEWTVLSCIVKYETAHQEIEVVSLGTGSKCVGATKMSPRGDILNDSHAEVFARRGFLLYLYENIERALRHECSVFSYNNGRFEIKNGIEFVFYSSQLPCGDASIIPKSENKELFGDILQTNKRKLEDSSQTEHKKAKLEDIHRTGAKCLPHTEQDSKESGAKYHTLGLVRTKPGRGDRTLSVSCSDKLARWTHLGIQGRLLSILCQPIYIKHYIFGAGVPYSEESLHRAILNRNSGCTVLKLEIIPEFYQSSLNFQSIKTDTKIRPTAGSIVWVKLNNP